MTLRLATIRTPDGHRCVRIDSDQAIEVGAADVVELLQDPGWRTRTEGAAGAGHDLASLDFAPLVPRPEKIICVGLNYAAHIREMGRELPEVPTFFAKFHRALIGANDEISLPAVSQAVDWEAELGIVVGHPLRNASPDEATASIAGFTVVNDITGRDWQYRTTQWLQGKTFEATTPVGPYLVVPERAEPAPGYEIVCAVDGEVMQSANTSDLVFNPATLLSYLSEIITLVPGDLIATGTPGGVGHGRDPKRYLKDGSLVVTTIEGIGECRNHCRATA
jgi:acylpyruvate hydrolase